MPLAFSEYAPGTALPLPIYQNLAHTHIIAYRYCSAELGCCDLFVLCGSGAKCPFTKHDWI